MPEGTMRAVVKAKPEPGIELMEMPIPQINEKEVLVKVKACAVCGSDVHTYLWEESMHYKTKLLPLILGHEFCGEIVETGAQVQDAKVGDRVIIKPSHRCGKCYFCRTGQPDYCTGILSSGTTKNGAMAKYCAVYEDQLVKMPDNMTWEQGAIVEPLAVAVQCVRRAEIGYGDFVVVSGTGPIGLLCVLVARAVGAGRIAIFGRRNVKRLEMAKELGADYAFRSDECDVVEEIKKLTNGLGADVALEAAGAAPLLQTDLDCVHKFGKVCCVGIYASPATFNLDNMVRTSKRIIGTYSGNGAFEDAVQWLTGNNELAKAAEKIITHRSALADAQEVFARARRQESIKDVFVNFD